MFCGGFYGGLSLLVYVTPAAPVYNNPEDPWSGAYQIKNFSKKSKPLRLVRTFRVWHVVFPNHRWIGCEKNQ